jgi:hypothetical protein
LLVFAFLLVLLLVFWHGIFKHRKFVLTFTVTRLRRHGLKEKGTGNAGRVAGYDA